MFDLFNPLSSNLSDSNSRQDNLFGVSGLTYIKNYISPEEATSLFATIINLPWLNDLKRRVQHYGYRYDYKERKIDYTMFIGDLPTWGFAIAQRIADEKLMEEVPDQMIVNEYLPGQGIASHIDCEPCFRDTIISLSLNSPCIMEFVSKKGDIKHTLLLEPRSLVVIKGDARYEWKHGIPARKADFYNGTKCDRKHRISLTFRKVILPE